MRAIRSYLFQAIMILSIPPFVTCAILFWPFPYSVRWTVIKQWARFQMRLLGWLCGLHYEVEGAEQLPKPPYIILAKHQSTWETLAFQLIFPPSVWVAKRELLWVPWFGWGLAMTDPIMIDRSAGQRAADQIVERGGKRLRQGRCVTIFPEGTRVSAGTRRKYGLGGAMLAAESGFPVIPVAHNAGSYWGRRSNIIQPGVIRVVIGPAIETGGLSAEQIRERTENWIETRMMELEHRNEWAELVRGRHPGKS